MDAFSFVFSLFGLILGLALTEVLAGFGNVLQERRKVRVGWQTPLLGLLVALDLTSFWMVAWALRASLPARYFTLLSGLLLCGTYYLAARLTFPKKMEDWPDLDVYHQQHKAWVLGGIFLCNVIALAVEQAAGWHPWLHTIDWITTAVFYPALAAAMAVRDKRVNIALLAFLCLQYVVIPSAAILSGQVHRSERTRALQT